MSRSDTERSPKVAAESRDVRTVIVDGEVLVEEGKVVRLDEEKLMEQLQSRAEWTWEQVPKWHWAGKGVDEVLPPAFKFK